jgi:hypothetical protein
MKWRDDVGMSKPAQSLLTAIEMNEGMMRGWVTRLNHLVCNVFGEIYATWTLKTSNVDFKKE